MRDLSSQKELDVGSDKEVAQSYSKMLCGDAACYFSDHNNYFGFTNDISGFFICLLLQIFKVCRLIYPNEI